MAMTLSLDGKPKTADGDDDRIIRRRHYPLCPAADAAFHAGLNFAIPRHPRARQPVHRHGMKDVTAREGDPGKRAMMKKRSTPSGTTLKAGVVDFHIAAGTPKSGGNYNVLAALGVQGGDKIESTVRDLVGQIPAGDRAKDHDRCYQGQRRQRPSTQDRETSTPMPNGFSDPASARGPASARPRSCSASAANAAATFAGMTTNDLPKPAPMLVIEGSLASWHRWTKIRRRIKSPARCLVLPPQRPLRLSVNGGKLLKLDLSFKGRGVTFLQQL